MDVAKLLLKFTMLLGVYPQCAKDLISRLKIRPRLVPASFSNLGPRLCPLKNRRSEPGNIRGKSCRLPLRHHACDRLLTRLVCF